MIQINKDNGRLSAWGVAASTVSIRWRKQPTNLPVFQHPLDLRGLQIYADFSDGTSEDITQFCSFTPSQGTPVYDEQYVNVTASYVEKSGKTITADTSLPVCYPAELRLVVNSDPIYENYLDTTSPLFDPDTMPMKKGIFKPYCVWKRIDPRTEQEITVRITPVSEENMFYQYNPEQDGSDVFPVYTLQGEVTWVISSVEKPLEDVTNWHNPYSPTIESFERPLVVHAQASIGVISLSTDAYIETVPIKLTYADLPTEPVQPRPGTSDIPHILLSKDNIRFSWGDYSDPVEPVAGLNDMWLAVGGSTTSGWDEMDIAWGDDGDEFGFYSLRRNPANHWGGPSDEPYEYTEYIGKRVGDNVEWRKVEE